MGTLGAAHRPVEVWTLAEDDSVYVVEHPGRAGNCVLTIVLEELGFGRASLDAG